MKFTRIAFLFALTLFSSCAMNDETLLPPESEMASADRTESDLSVFIDPSIQNEFEVNAPGAPAARFQKYRTTIENAFRSTFSKYFNGVRFTDSIPSRGVFVRLSQAAPKPTVVASPKRSSREKVGLEISWAGEVFRNGIRVHRTEGKALSEESADRTSSGTDVLKDAFRVMTEQFGAEIRAIADGADPSTPVANGKPIPTKKGSL